MKKNGKHIKYLKAIIEFFVNNIVVIIISVLFFLMLLYNDIMCNVSLFAIHKINDFFDFKFSSQSSDKIYNLMRKCENAFLSVLVGIILNKIISLCKRKKDYASQLRRYIYYHLNKIYTFSNKWIICAVIPKLINVFLHGKPLNYYNQTNHIKKLMEYIGLPNSEKHIVWIQGEAYSGKTTIVFRFIEELTNKNNFELFKKYEKHIYYFDLGTPSLEITTIHEYISQKKFENALLILDNIHKLDLNGLRVLVVTLESYHNNVKFVICLSRYFEDYCFSQELSERLKEFIDNYAEELNINAYNSKLTKHKTVEKNVLDEIFTNTKKCTEDFQDFCNRIVKKEQYNNLSLLVQCYNLYNSIRSPRLREFIYNVFDSLNKDVGNTALKVTLSFIIYATLFSGGFEVAWYHEFLKTLKIRHLQFQAKRQFRALRKSNFISIVWGSNTGEVVFHEKLARYYFEVINENNSYKEINNAVIHFLLLKNKDYNRIPNAWRYNLLLKDDSQNDILFDESMCVANFKTLLEDLNYIIKVKQYPQSLFYRELGILSDRFGKLNIAANYFEKLLSRSFNPSVFINLIQVDHSKYNKFVLRPLMTDKKDPYIRIAAKYWIAHMDLHDGKFQFYHFSKLLSEWVENKTYVLNLHPYDGLHLLRRWYFDCFRIYYLSGIFNPDMLKPIINSGLLKGVENLPELDPYDYKFRCAFFLHYDVLFQKGFLENLKNEKFENWCNLMLNTGHDFYKRFVQARYNGKSEIDMLVEEAIEYYSASSNGLKKIMDKSYRYSDLRIWELKLAYDVVNPNDIFNNEKFIKDYIHHSLDIQVYEYVAYGYTYLLKNYLVGQYCIYQEYDDNPNPERKLKNLYITDELIQDCFNNIIYYHNLYRDAEKNNYAIFRCKIYKVLYDYSRNNIRYEEIETLLNALMQHATQMKYQREELALNHLLRNKISRIHIYKFFKFYPLVLQ